MIRASSDGALTSLESTDRTASGSTLTATAKPFTPSATAAEWRPAGHSLPGLVVGGGSGRSDGHLNASNLVMVGGVPMPPAPFVPQPAGRRHRQRDSQAAKEKEREKEEKARKQWEKESDALLRPQRFDEMESVREAVRLGDIKIFRNGDFDPENSYIAPKAKGAQAYPGQGYRPGQGVATPDTRMYKIFCGQLGPTTKVQYLVLNAIGDLCSTYLHDVKEKGRNCRTFAVEGEATRDEVLSWTKCMRCTENSVYVALTRHGRRIIQEMGVEKGGPDHPVTIEIEHSELQREENRQKKPKSASPNNAGPNSSSQTPISSPTGTVPAFTTGGTTSGSPTGVAPKATFSAAAPPFIPGIGYQRASTDSLYKDGPVTETSPPRESSQTVFANMKRNASTSSLGKLDATPSAQPTGGNNKGSGARGRESLEEKKRIVNLLQDLETVSTD
jgi:hypothetical protein